MLQASFPKNDKVHLLVPYNLTYHDVQRFTAGFELTTDTQYIKKKNRCYCVPNCGLRTVRGRESNLRDCDLGVSIMKT